MLIFFSLLLNTFLAILILFMCLTSAIFCQTFCKSFFFHLKYITVTLITFVLNYLCYLIGYCQISHHRSCWYVLFVNIFTILWWSFLFSNFAKLREERYKNCVAFDNAVIQLLRNTVYSSHDSCLMWFPWNTIGCFCFNFQN